MAATTHPSADEITPEDRVVLAIGGMTCGACVRRVEKALRKAPGVSDAMVDLATHRATVVYEPGVTGAAALAAVVADAGYRAALAGASDPALDDRRDLTHRLWVAIVAGVPVIVVGMSHGVVTVPGAAWIELLLSALVLGWAGAPIYRAAWSALRHRGADMNVLVGLGTSAAFVYSVVATVSPSLFGGHHAAAPVYYEVAVTVVALVLLGRWLEARARQRAGEAMGRLRSLVPPTATVKVDAHEERIAVERIKPGDLVVIRPGQTIPVDGEVVEGESSVAEAVLTGEAMPIDKRPGAMVFAGTSNSWGRLVVRATRAPSETALASIVAAVEQAMATRAEAARLADRLAGVLTPIVLAIAAATFAGWMFLDGDVARALLASVSVLVVACPCALGLATPMALVVGLGRAVELGMVFRSAAALEHLGAIDTLVLDKTGTLTEGQPDLVEEVMLGALEPARVLALVAGAEEGSEHPLAGAFLRAAGARGIAVPPATGFAATPGRGVVATVDGHQVVVGSPRFVAEHGVVVEPAPIAAVTARGLSPAVVAIGERSESHGVGALPALPVGRGRSPLGIGERAAAIYGIGDAPRPAAAEAVRRLRAAGIDVVMLTGDARAVADLVAARVGIERVIAEASPDDKAREVGELRAAGRRVAMVGDGVNDAPALAAATVGVAMGSATDVAAASADVVLRRDDLGALVDGVLLARRTRRVIRQNLGWAFGYNALALPIAAGVLYPLTGWQLSPMLASAAMALSSLSVIGNSLRLRRAV